MEKPKVWCVLNDGSDEFKQTVVKYLNNNYVTSKTNYSGCNRNHYYGINKYCNHDEAPDSEIFNNNILTIEQFKNIFMRKVIGYKIKPEFEKNRKQIADALKVLEHDIDKRYYMAATSNVDKRAKELGVLELWFEPVYENDKIEICGKQVEFGCDFIRVDNSEYYKRDLDDVKRVLMLPKVKGIVVGCKEEKLTLETIDKILNRLK